MQRPFAPACRAWPRASPGFNPPCRRASARGGSYLGTRVGGLAHGLTEQVSSTNMNEHQRQTAFLRQCIRYDDTAEHHQLEERITVLQRDEICVRRAVWLMVLFAALAMAGLCYAVVLLEDYPLNLSQFTAQSIIKVLCALGVGSLICLVAFLGLGAIYRKELDQRREECRRLATKLIETRLSKPNTPLRNVANDPA